jgi:type I restriction enzyme M protein
MFENTFKNIDDILHKDAGCSSELDYVEQSSWVLFLKYIDDLESARKVGAELGNKKYSPIISGKYSWSQWAVPKGEDGKIDHNTALTGDDLRNFVNNELFPFLAKFKSTATAPDTLEYKIGEIFGEIQNRLQSGYNLREVLELVDQLKFQTSAEIHEMSHLYEDKIKNMGNAGRNGGEYYTPRAVTQFAIDMVAPKLGETIFDPACGTGGFLSCSIEYVRRTQVKRPEQESRLQASIRGVEKKPLPHLLCVTNMIVHGIDVPTGIAHDNTLSRPLRDIGAKDRVDVIVTNPPFGGMEEDGIENNFPAAFRTRETADLFLVYIVEMLKPGGRAAVVLPDGTLFGEGVKTRIKEHLLTECDLHTIVRMPKGVFAPYTSIKTNVLFFTKGTPTKEVWYYEHPYPEGVTSYNKTKPMRIEEFDAEKVWWG